MTGTFAVEAGEVQRDGPLAVGAQAVYGTAERLRLTRIDIEDAGNEMVAFTVVVDDFAVGVVEPLEHACLLPAPGVGLGDLAQRAVLLDDADGGLLARHRLPCHEIDLQGQEATPLLVPRKLVEIAEEMMFGSFRDPAYGKMFLFDHNVILLGLAGII